MTSKKPGAPSPLGGMPHGAGDLDRRGSSFAAADNPSVKFMVADLARSGLRVEDLPRFMQITFGEGDHPVARRHPSLRGAPWYRIWYGRAGESYYADRIDTDRWEPRLKDEEKPGKYHAKSGPAELLVVTPDAPRAGRWWLVEGVKKALAWHKATGLPTIAFPGCDMLLARNMQGTKKRYTLRKPLAAMARSGVAFTVLFDADLTSNPNVYRAACRAREAGLQARINPTEHKGIDDLIVATKLAGQALIDAVEAWEEFDPARHAAPAATAATTPVLAFFEDYWFIEGLGQFINTRILEYVSTHAFDVSHAHRVPAGVTATTIFKRQAGHKAHRVDFDPDQPEVYVVDKVVTLNLFRKPNIEPRRGDVGPLLAHLDHLFEGKAEDIDRMRRWFRAVCVTPGVKLRWMPLLISKDRKQGTGRNSLIEVAHRAIGDRLFGVATGRALAGRFTSYVLGKTLVVVSELEVAESKRDAYANIKERISDDYILMDEKGVREHTIRNRVNFVAFSNAEWPIALAEHDRRVWVVETTNRAMPNPAAFHAWLAREETPGAVLWHLLHEVEPADHAFINEPPPVTELKLEIIERSRPRVEVALDELVQAKHAPFDRELFTLAEVHGALQVELGFGDKRATSDEALAGLLRRRGFARLDKRGESQRRYWACTEDRKRLEELSPKKLDQLYQGPRGARSKF